MSDGPKDPLKSSTKEVRGTSSEPKSSNPEKPSVPGDNSKQRESANKTSKPVAERPDKITERLTDPTGGRYFEYGTMPKLKRQDAMARLDEMVDPDESD